MKCIKTITKKHLWSPFEIRAECGTVGYYRTYVLKCEACGIVDDRFKYESSPPDHSETQILDNLLKQQKKGDLTRGKI